MLSPIVTATLQATAIASASNVLAQYIEQRDHEGPFTLSLPDFLRFVILSLLTAPPNFLWQMFLERTFPGRKAVPVSDPEDAEKGNTEEEGEKVLKLDWKNTMIKWFVDCISMGALLNTTAFLILMGLMKGRTWNEIATALRTETFPIIFASYKIWPLASVVNFALIPVEKRIVFLSAVGLGWGIYMSLAASRQ
ncbi:hypothetical protein D6C85_07007 [Lecanosticta acicola]|uniref:Uncharacterized protein n=1 Tax=Lecanosticta acicola TaxID=111012 RepID=A0AAI8W0K0_9PEZI|nr:hypothetical protein D6C85_07007 [Lecanosticta acicola]